MSSLQGRELERGVGANKADLEAKSVSEVAKRDLEEKKQRSEEA